MKKELDYFMIDGVYGGNQDFMEDKWMKIGGCAALTACDSCIYLAMYMGMKKLYPYDIANLCKADYIRFGNKMKPYISPRWSGVNRLDIYMEGFGQYLQDIGAADLLMRPFHGNSTAAEAKEAVIRQIEGGFPIPYLNLKHKKKKFRDYVWHWFLLNGYQQEGDHLLVKAATYGEWEWLNLDELWDTGYEQKGGMILYDRFLVSSENAC